jgi:UDP-N-acetylglucosamine acyltransferase
VALAGHVHIGDWAILSGYTLVHQFCRIGPHSFSGMQTAIGKDVPAYVTVSGSPAEAKTINTEGCGAADFPIRDQPAAPSLQDSLPSEPHPRHRAAAPRNDAQRDAGGQVLIDSIRASERGIVR